MEGITVHKLNDKLVVSLYDLPGFNLMGTCAIRGEDGKCTGRVPVYYVGTFFNTTLKPGELDKVAKATMRLAQNHAVRQDIGRFATRLNLSSPLRRHSRKRTDTANGVHDVQNKETASPAG